MLPQVSVAIISYQQAQFIGTALQSVVDQDYPNLQIVVSDDNSTDGTADEIQRFAKRYSDRIVPVLNSERGGITVNSNRAMRRCTGKYFCILGGDDLFLPGKIERQVEWLERRPKRVLCGHQAEVFYEDGSRAPHRFQRQLLRGVGAASIIRRGAFSAGALMVRANRIPAGGFDERLRLVSDFKLCVDVVREDGEFGFVPGTLSRYRRHDSNASSNGSAMAEDAERALDIIALELPRYADECRLAKARFVDFPKGQFHLAHGDRKSARKDFLKAVRREPGFARGWLELAKAL